MVVAGAQSRSVSIAERGAWIQEGVSRALTARRPRGPIYGLLLVSWKLAPLTDHPGAGLKGEFQRFWKAIAVGVPCVFAELMFDKNHDLLCRKTDRNHNDFFSHLRYWGQRELAEITSSRNVPASRQQNG